MRTGHRPDSPRGWVVVGAAFASMFVVFGVAYSFGAFFEPMADEFGTGRGATSAVFSVTAFAYFGLGVVSGRAVDRFGPRPVLVAGGLALGTGLVLTSLVSSLWVGYATYGAGVGIGVACGYVPMVAVVGAWFERRRSTAIGVAVAGIGVGTLAGAPLAAALIEVHGWRTTYVVFGLASCAVMLASAAVVARPPAPPAGSRQMRLRDVAKEPAFRWLYVSIIPLAMALFVPFVYVASFAEDNGTGAVAAAALVGVLGGASTVGRLVLGVVADRVGHVRTYQACVLLLALSFAIWLSVTSYGWLLVFVLTMGIGYGGFIALAPAVAAQLFGVANLGAILGLLYTAAGLGAVVGPPLAGVVIDATGSYRPAIAGALVLGLVSFALPLAMRVEKTG